MKNTIFSLIIALLAGLTASAQLSRYYLVMSQGGTITSHNLQNIGNIEFGSTGITVTDNSTTPQANSYAYTTDLTGAISSTADHVHSYVNGFCTCVLAPYEPATQAADGYYEIDNGGKLFWLAEQVNNGVGTAYSARLTADIDLEDRLWIPMGDATYAHTGAFDGQGHDITGLNIVAEASTIYAAFIGNHTGTMNISNFHISGIVTVKGTANTNYAAGVVANANGSHKIQDVWCSVNITNANTTDVSSRFAGIVTHALSCTVNRCIYDGTIDGKATSLQVAGIIGWADNNNVSLTNCLFNGTLSSTGTGSGSAYMGGLLGYTSRTVNCANNLSIGILDSPAGATRTGAIVGQSTYATPSVFVNNYVLEGLPVAGTANAAARVPSATEATATTIANGTVAAALGSDNWTMNEGKVVPITFGPVSHTHSYSANGFCIGGEGCTEPYTPATQDSEGYYEIDNGGKLFWLAQQVNSGAGSAYNARLTADINLENRLWTPMGDATNKHTGTFDGQGYSITGLNVDADAATLYAAFIGYHSGTNDVKNFKISGSVAIAGTLETNYAAGVVAYSTGAHKIQDVWSSVNISLPNTTAAIASRSAGVVTKAEGGTINRCVYDGTIYGYATNLQVAGILGWPNANNTTVSNCLFAGKLNSTGTGNNSAYMGGIVGYSPSTRSGLVFANNLSIGTLSSPSTATRSGALSGRSTVAASSFTNNYILQGLPIAGTATTASVMPTATEVTAIQLTDGNLAELLGSRNWVQGISSPIPQDNSTVTEDDMTIDGIKYIITSDNTVSVTYANIDQPSSSNPSTYSGEIAIPATVTIKGVTYNVTGIGDYAFHYADVTSLTLPEGIISLGYKSIYQTRLTEITVPNSVTAMDYEALGYNKQLVTINFGENIAADTWGDKLCIYGGKKYEVYMNCNAVPKLRSYTFDFTGANVHVRPTMYAAFKADAAWSTYDIIGDLWVEYTYEDLQTTIATYEDNLPTGDAVGTDPGCYTVTSVDALAAAIAGAKVLDESASLEQLNNAINNILIAYDALKVNELQEGYYYIESLYKPGYAMTFNADAADTEGITTAAFDAAQDKFYFRLTRHGGNWYVQDVANGMYMGTAVGGNSNGKYLSITDAPEYEQAITWVAGGAYKLQNIYIGTSASYPYRYYNYRVNIYNHADSETRIHWRFHPVEPGRFPLDFNLENGRVRTFVHDFEYAAGDASKISTYNQAPPARRDQPVPATIFWTRNASSTAQQIQWSTDATFADATTISVDNNDASYEIYNLLPGRTYYYKVTATVDGNPAELISSTFTTSGNVRQIKADGVSNIRDLGGWTTASGATVSYGRIYRGAAFNATTITPEGIAALRAVGVKAELDLRGNSEAGNITQSLLGSDISYKRTALGQTASHMNGLTNSTSIYTTAVQYVLDCVKSDKPVYFHCAIGRDRTGTLAFLLEGVLGMSKNDICKDYELTNFSNLNTPCSKTQLDEMFTMIEGQEGATLEEKFRTYLTSKLGISAADIDAFRTKMLGLEEVTIGATGYSTYVNDDANLVIPEGVTAYGITAIDGSELLLTQLSGSVLAVGEPVILAGEAGKQFQFIGTSELGSSVAGNLLEGTGTTGKVVGDSEAYVLYDNEGTAVFRIASAMTLPANKAYLPAGIVDGSGVKEFTLSIDDLTGIAPTANGQSPIVNKYVYDLRGRKVAAPHKGHIYIVNGQKVLFQ